MRHEGSNPSMKQGIKVNRKRVNLATSCGEKKRQAARAVDVVNATDMSITYLNRSCRDKDI